jgi:hypothetical protein
MTTPEREQQAKDRERYSDLAERLAAAWISHQHGRASIDYVLKKHVRDRNERIGQAGFRSRSRSARRSLRWAMRLRPLRIVTTDVFDLDAKARGYLVDLNIGVKLQIIPPCAVERC